MRVYHVRVNVDFIIIHPRQCRSQSGIKEITPHSSHTLQNEINKNSNLARLAAGTAGVCACVRVCVRRSRNNHDTLCRRKTNVNECGQEEGRMTQ